MRSYTFLLVFVFCSLFSVAQTTSTTSSTKAVETYFKIPRETVFLHLNKSTFVSQDEIWFKGYVHDRKNGLPSLATTNFNVELFDVLGNEVYSGLFLGYEGITKGNIKIDPNWSSGEYYIRISTNWMNNFIEDDSFTAKIRILNKELQAEKGTENTGYDFQLLPEGGHMVAGTENTVGFKLLNDKGRGKSFDEGLVVDDSGNTVASLTSNSFGMGKFKIRPILGKRYEAKITLSNGEEVTTPLTNIKSTGIAINVDHMSKDSIKIVFNTNSATLKNNPDKKYYLLVHQNQKSRKIAVSFEHNKVSKIITLPKKELYPGINILTLFNDNTPLLERLIFNATDKIITNVRVSKLNKRQDSVIMSINVPNSRDVLYDLSVSVLPKETKSYEHQDNILSAMLLRPYVKATVENPRHYFTEIDSKASDLDLLLLTQGWSRYNWNNVFTNKPKISYDFNRGLVLRGRIQNTKVSNIEKVYLFPFENNPGQVIDLNRADNSFVVNKLFLRKNQKLRFSTIRSNGSMARTNMYLKTQTNRFKKVYQTNPYNGTIKTSVSVPEAAEVLDIFYGKNVEQLDKVVITGADKPEQLDDVFISGNVKRNSKKIDLKDTQNFPNILDYIATKGFRIKYGYHINTTPLVTILPINSVTVNGSGVAVYIDDFRLFNLDILLDLPTADIDRILVDKNGSVTGLSGAGTIFIYTRKIPLEGYGNKNESSYITEHNIEKGFEPIKEFYTPKYTNYSSSGFEKFVIIHWEPQLQPNKDGVAVFKIPDTGLENISFFIEGMGSDGSLISKMHTIKNGITNQH